MAAAFPIVERACSKLFGAKLISQHGISSSILIVNVSCNPQSCNSLCLHICAV